MRWARGRPGPGGRLWGRVRAGTVNRVRRAVRAIGRLLERRAGPSSCAGTCEAVQGGRGSSGAGGRAVVHGRRGVEWWAVSGVGGRVVCWSVDRGARGLNVVRESFWKKFGIEVDTSREGCIVEVRRRDNDPTTGRRKTRPTTNEPHGSRIGNRSRTANNHQPTPTGAQIYAQNFFEFLFENFPRYPGYIEYSEYFGKFLTQKIRRLPTQKM